MTDSLAWTITISIAVLAICATICLDRFWDHKEIMADKRKPAWVAAADDDDANNDDDAK
jgi:hypothetical protein